MAVDPNEHDRFLLRQRIRPVVNQYEFFLPGGDGTPGPPICFVEQKRFKFKEDIRFYADESKGQEILRIKARQRFDPRARYDVTDPSGMKVGEIQKVFGASLLRSTYALFDAAGEETARATERSLVVALFRRLVGLVPFIGGFADWLLGGKRCRHADCHDRTHHLRCPLRIIVRTRLGSANQQYQRGSTNRQMVR